MNSLGQKIRNLRKERNITQQELCRGLVTASMISQIESDRATPSAQLLEEIARRLSVEVSYFAQDVSAKTDLSQMYRRAKSLVDSNKLEEALPLFLAVAFPLATQFRAEAVYNDLANCYAKLGRLHDAANTYELVVQAAFERDDIPLAVHTYFNLGHIERRRGQFTVARMYWQRASELLARYADISMPVSLKIHANLGKLYLSENKYDVALRFYKKASELAVQYSAISDLATIYHGLSCASVGMGALDQALECNQLAIDAFQQTHNASGINRCQVNQAFILRKAGRFEESVELLSSCIRSRSFNTDKIQFMNAYSERASCLLEMGQTMGALDDSKRVLELSGEDEKIKHGMWLLRARAYVGNQSYAEGLNELNYCQERFLLQDQGVYAEYNRIKRECLMGLGRNMDARVASIAFANQVLVS